MLPMHGTSGLHDSPTISRPLSPRKKDADVQVAILLELAGPDSLAIHKMFAFAEGDNVNDYELVLRKFTDYCRPRKTLCTRGIVFGNVTRRRVRRSTNGSLNSERKQPCASSDLKKNS